MTQTKKLLVEHCRAYPKAQLTDVFKFIYQSSFGCEHLLSNTDSAIAYIKSEYEFVRQKPREIEPLDGEYSRVPLSYLDKGLSPETFGKIFALSAKHEENGKAELLKKLGAARELILNGELPFVLDEFDSAVSEWESLGYPAVRHSVEFREEYTPSYRVISNEYLPFLPLLSAIDSLDGRGSVAIDGGSASGKSTLASLLEKLYSCTVFHMDDYFLPPEKRTPERFSEVGGNVDHERFLSEVLEPLSKGEGIKMRKFDCRTMSFSEEIEVTPQKLVIVEGAYSMHPNLEGYYDLSAFLDVSPEAQKARILRRNSPEFAKRFFNEWIPLENIYFEKAKIRERCSVTVKISIT